MSWLSAPLVKGALPTAQCTIVRCVGRLDEASCSSILGPSDLPTPRANVPILSPACMLLRCSVARSRSSLRGMQCSLGAGR